MRAGHHVSVQHQNRPVAQLHRSALHVDAVLARPQREALPGQAVIARNPGFQRAGIDHSRGWQRLLRHLRLNHQRAGAGPQQRRLQTPRQDQSFLAELEAQAPIGFRHRRVISDRRRAWGGGAPGRGRRIGSNGQRVPQQPRNQAGLRFQEAAPMHQPGSSQEKLLDASSAPEVRVMVSQTVMPGLGEPGGAAPMAFTEQDAVMLASVLRSPRTVQVNIASSLGPTSVPRRSSPAVVSVESEDPFPICACRSPQCKEMSNLAAGRT
jgi:hypothetical protein